MATEIDICNLALSGIRGGSINSLTEASLQAQQCSLHYPIARDLVLTDATWNFATSIKPLALRADIDVHNWAYAYQYPSDCLYIDKLMLNYEAYTSTVDSFYRTWASDLIPPDLDRQIKYRVLQVNGEKIIVANDADLHLQYRVKTTNTLLFDTVFVQAVSHLLGSYLAVPIIGGELGRAMQSDKLQLYNHYLNSAVANNKNEEYFEPVESEFITTRR